MIDIHSHVLPFVDDGSPDTESSMKLLDECVKAGVTDLFLTPHYMKLRNFLSEYAQNLEKFEAFCIRVREAEIPIRLYLGNEIYYTISTVKDLKAKKVIPLGNSDKVLLEFSLSQEDEDIAEAIHNLRALGWIPVIAHPERYPYLKLSDFPIIKKMGALIQVNASSLLGKHGAEIEKRAFRLIKDGYADFVASDLHVFRPNGMKEAYRIIEKKFGKETAIRLFENRSVL
jgi:protein-tyrosine phosphatase